MKQKALLARTQPVIGLLASIRPYHAAMLHAFEAW